MCQLANWFSQCCCMKPWDKIIFWNLIVGIIYLWISQYTPTGWNGHFVSSRATDNTPLWGEIQLCQLPHWLVCNTLCGYIVRSKIYKRKQNFYHSVVVYCPYQNIQERANLLPLCGGILSVSKYTREANLLPLCGGILSVSKYTRESKSSSTLWGCIVRSKIYKREQIFFHPLGVHCW